MLGRVEMFQFYANLRTLAALLSLIVDALIAVVAVARRVVEVVQAVIR
jgi:hypothetical protein